MRRRIPTTDDWATNMKIKILKKSRRHDLRLLAAAILLFGQAFGSEVTASDQASLVWGEDYFPNVSLTTQDGQSVRFFDDLIKDKVVAINFVYTNCPDACPMATASMAKTQKLLGERMGQDVFMYSITVDPERDTPAVLKEYSKQFQAGPGWTFLTGNADDLILIRKKLGLYIEEIQDGSFDHNTSIIIGNQATGQWMKRSPMENPYYLATQLGSWLHNWEQPDPNANSYADAPELRTLSMGEHLFRTRCAVCHSIGQGDIMKTGELAGPDLLGVTMRRDPFWLANWLANPDEMLKQEDPIVMEMYEKFNRIAMPNLHLNRIEVASLMDYMDKETRRLGSLQADTNSAAHENHHEH